MFKMLCFIAFFAVLGLPACLGSNNVYNLNERDFEGYIRDKDIMLVDFFAPWWVSLSNIDIRDHASLRFVALRYLVIGACSSQLFNSQGELTSIHRTSIPIQYRQSLSHNFATKTVKQYCGFPCRLSTSPVKKKNVLLHFNGLFLKLSWDI